MNPPPCLANLYLDRFLWTNWNLKRIARYELPTYESVYEEGEGDHGLEEDVGQSSQTLLLVGLVNVSPHHRHQHELLSLRYQINKTLNSYMYC